MRGGETLVFGFPRRAGLGAAFVGALAIAIAPAAAAGQAGSGVPLRRGWAANPVWDDGLAEVSVYEARRGIYGKPRPHTLRAILVKEDLDTATLVKADPPYEGKTTTSVLKLNLVSTVPTDNYSYNFLASLFVSRADVGRLVKASAGIQEWCGNTFKELTPRADGWLYHFHSYFDGEGDGSRTVPAGPDAYLEEQLLVVARAARLDEGGSVAIRVADPILSNHANPFALRRAVLKGGPVERVTTPAGAFPAQRIDLEIEGGGVTRYWVGKDPTRSLLKVEGTDGFEMLLRESARRDYWTR